MTLLAQPVASQARHVGLASLANLTNLANLANLAEGQSALLQQIRQTGPNHGLAFSRGLQAYRANARIAAASALGAAYPVVAQLIGSEGFEAMARHFWHMHPPTRGDWAQWGADLPSFLAHAPQLAQEPYLADVARTEWALHQCAGAADCAPDAASFALLSQHAPEKLGLTLSAASIVASAYPVVRIIQAHSADGSGMPNSTALATIHTAMAETALVWRKGFVPQLCAVQGNALAFVSAIAQGQSLANALDQAAEGFDFSAWLTNCFQNGLVLGAVLLNGKASL